MKRLLGILALVLIGSALDHVAPVLDATALANYETLFAVLGGSCIVFMVMVVAAGDSPTALPPAFRPTPLPNAGHCLVCNAESASSWVRCTRCDAPYHWDCARYLKGCAVFGCAKNPPQLTGKQAETLPVTRTGERRSD